MTGKKDSGPQMADMIPPEQVVAGIGKTAKTAKTAKTGRASAGPVAKAAAKAVAKPAIKPSLKGRIDDLVESGHLLGWREWAALPDFGIPLIKAKVDTGARTSSLHAINPRIIERGHEKFVIFTLPHYRGDGHGRIECCAPLVEKREIRSSNGKAEERYVIATTLAIGLQRIRVEMSLANRSLMGFPMLIGRTAMRAGRFLVLPSKSYLAGKPEPVYTALEPDEKTTR